MPQRIEAYVMNWQTLTHHWPYSRDDALLTGGPVRRCLQRLALWVLRRTGCCRNIDERMISRVVLDTSSIVKAAMQQKASVEKCYGERPKYLLVGADQYRRLSLMAEHDSQPYHRTHLPLEVFGMKVIIVPWMDGMVVLPEVRESPTSGIPLERSDPWLNRTPLPGSKTSPS